MKLVIAFILVISSSRVFAWGLKDLGEEAASPVTTGARDVLIYGGAATLLAIVFEDGIDVVHDDVVEDKPLGDFSRYGDWAGQMVPNIAYILGQSVASASGNDKGTERALGMFKATAYATSVTTLLKYTIREPRPDNHSDRNSFPSGHATTAFAFGGYIFEEHGWKWGVPALMLSTLTGLSRVNDNRHRVHDVLAGATIGLAYGVGIVKLGKSKKNNEVSSYNIVPIYDADIKGIVVMKEF
jgi:PAP2 superfamily